MRGTLAQLLKCGEHEKCSKLSITALKRKVVATVTRAQNESKVTTVKYYRDL
jgi:hypothetical protein